MTRFPFLIHTHHNEVAIPSYCRRGSHNIILQQCQNHFHRWVRVHLSSVPRLAVFWTKKMNVNLTEMWLQKKTMSLPFLTHCLVLLCAETLQSRSCYCPFLSSVRKRTTICRCECETRRMLTVGVHRDVERSVEEKELIFHTASMMYGRLSGRWQVPSQWCSADNLL